VSIGSYLERRIATRQVDIVGFVHVQLRHIAGVELVSRTYGLVRRGAGGNGALRAAIARVARVGDGDLICAGSRTALRVGRGQSREEKDCELGMHFKELLSESVGG
jgi:hypothetical protein